MSLLFAGGMATQESSAGTEGTPPQGPVANAFVTSFINHFKNQDFQGVNLSIFRGGSGEKVQCYGSPAATYPKITFFSHASLTGTAYQNFYLQATETLLSTAKNYVGGKGKLIFGARIIRVAPLGNGPLVNFMAAPTGSSTAGWYSIPVTNEVQVYCEVLVDFTKNVIEVYINGVKVYSFSYNPSVIPSIYMGSTYIASNGSSSPTASLAPSSNMGILDVYVAVDSDTEESPFGLQGGIRIAYSQDVVSSGGSWSSEPLSEVKTKIMRNGGAGGTLVVSNAESGILELNKPLITTAGNWTPVGVTVESWSSRTDPTNVTALDFTVSTMEDREAIRGKSSTSASLSVGSGVTKQLPAKDYSFETGVKLSVLATKP